MSDAVWIALSTMGAAIIALFSAVFVQLLKMAGEIMGKKNEETLREVLERYHTQNTDKIEELEVGFKVLRSDIESVKTTIKHYHPKEA